MGRLLRSYRTDLSERLQLKALFKPVSPQLASERASVNQRGLITVEYPDVKLKPPENFRFIPFLVYEPVTDAAGVPIVDAATGKEEIGVERCTACGICAKVCPPQCIWIVRAVGDDGKPKPKAAEFYIDIDICMNCGYCAEFCPFDAIKMDNDYELAGYERHVNHIYDLQTLMKSTTYYESIKPTDYAAEEAARRAKEEAKAKKPAAAERTAAAAAAAAKAATPAMSTNVKAEGDSSSS
ncbi:MAG TPA: 4Fe-4S binding protein [Anaerolineae bacterium]|nr:4Fe-4S binding protein [Anaerolineae bacterium]